jgi:ubiquinone/menaquinone biosynthesis C-methylase UbiE
LEPGIIEDSELARYYSTMAKRYMNIPCQRVLKRVQAKKIERGKALDIGTGPGIFPLFLAKSLPALEFKGIDLSTAMINIARKNAAEEGIADRVSFDVASAYSLPFEDRSMDLVLSMNALHHLDSPVLFFNEVARVLKEDGGFVIVDFHRDTSPALVWFFNLLWKLFFGKDPKAREGFLQSLRSSYTVAECRQFLERSKLKRWNVYTRTVEMWIESVGSR